MTIRNISRFLCLITFILSTSIAATKIKPNDPDITIEGSHYTTFSDTLVDFQRHSDSLLQESAFKNKFSPLRAKTATGVSLTFSTDAPTVTAQFCMLPGENRTGSFAVFVDGKIIQTELFSPSKDSIITFDIVKPNTTEATEYTITMPNWGNVGFTGLTLPESFELLPIVKTTKPLYISYGNSITHGTGQSGTHETYPYQLAQKRNWQLKNVAVGGARTSLALAEMIRDDFDSIDFITILIGFNDYNGEGIDTTEYRNRYESILAAIREKHTKTKIFCITPTFTTVKNSEKTGIPLEEFRAIVRSVVTKHQAKSDTLIYLISGEELTTEEDLSDVVHLNVTGATALANGLSHCIDSLLHKTGIQTCPTRTSNNITVHQHSTHLQVDATAKIRTVKLYTTSGRLLQNNRGSQLSLTGLGKGCYIIEATTTFRNFHQMIHIK